MDKLVDYLWISFIVVESFFISTLFIFLRKEYVRAIKYYHEKAVAIQTRSVIKENNTNKMIITTNITKRIQTSEVENQLAYAQLIFYKNNKFHSRELMCENEISIGRGSINDINLGDITVSRRQCKIIKEKEHFILRNYAKRNITCINSKEVKKSKKIRYGDVITMGNITLVFNNILGEPSPTDTLNRRGKKPTIMENKVKTGTGG